VRNHVLAAFVVEQYDVIRLLLLIVDDHSRTAFAKRFDDLCGLGAGAALAGPPKASCDPPTPPEISQDLLSVTKTRGFSAAKLQTDTAKTILIAK
jgi:hypothetical protein